MNIFLQTRLLFTRFKSIWTIITNYSESNQTKWTDVLRSNQRHSYCNTDIHCHGYVCSYLLHQYNQTKILYLFLLPSANFWKFTPLFLSFQKFCLIFLRIKSQCCKNYTQFLFTLSLYIYFYFPFFTLYFHTALCYWSYLMFISTKYNLPAVSHLPYSLYSFCDTFRFDPH